MLRGSPLEGGEKGLALQAASQISLQQLEAMYCTNGERNFRQSLLRDFHGVDLSCSVTEIVGRLHTVGMM